MNITVDDIENAIQSAAKGRKSRKDVSFVLRNLSSISLIIYSKIMDGTWADHMCFRQMEITNKNGKDRHVNSPDFYTLVLEHLANHLTDKAYAKLDNNIGLNCKPGYGITAKKRSNSVVKRLKHIYYDRRDLQYATIIDQRHCYMHMRPKHARRALKALNLDSDTIDFIVSVSFVDNQLPVGTPTSPPIHHIIMLAFDLWLKKNCPMAVRYADDVFMPFATKEEAQQMKWRVKQFWWYVYGVRAKSTTQRVVSLDQAVDFCGYVFHRNPDKKITSHDKGYVTMRKSTYKSAIECKTNESYASYFGLMVHADMFKVLKKIEEKNMNLRELTQKIKIDRKLDAENIEMKDLASSGVEFTIYDYDLRKDPKGNYNWIKCLIGIPEKNKEGEPTGKILAREYHGGADAIVKFHAECEKIFGGKDALLPMTEMVIESKCGYIYKGSTNMLETIDESYERKK